MIYLNKLNVCNKCARKCRFLLPCTHWREGGSTRKGSGKAQREHPTWAHAEGALSQEPELRVRAGQGKDRAWQHT